MQEDFLPISCENILRDIGGFHGLDFLVTWNIIRNRRRDRWERAEIATGPCDGNHREESRGPAAEMIKPKRGNTRSSSYELGAQRIRDASCSIQQFSGMANFQSFSLCGSKLLRWHNLPHLAVSNRANLQLVPIQITQRYSQRYHQSKKCYFFNHTSNQVTITHITVVVHADTKCRYDLGVMMKLHSQHLLRWNEIIQFSEPSLTEAVKG
jgi:hypothetical protein